MAETMTRRKWYVGAQNDGLSIIDRPPSPSGTDVIWEGPKDLNVIASVHDCENFDQTRAHANLLAAAPELLAALKALRAEVPPYSLGSALLGKVSDAIAKAEGRLER